MERSELIRKLTAILLEEMPRYQYLEEQFSADEQGHRLLLRSLMNLRPPYPLNREFLAMQDELLSAETEEKQVVEAEGLAVSKHPNIILWRGDITRLRADAIVNAANSALLGCFHPCHGCIDNAIHSAAGLQLRQECCEIMEKQGCSEPPGRAKITAAYNLPCSYVIHTVGPIITGRVHQQQVAELASCYRSCLALAEEYSLKTLAFCCISTGEFHFPAGLAAETAADTVKSFLNGRETDMKVIFNVYKESDEKIYQAILEKGL